MEADEYYNDQCSWHYVVTLEEKTKSTGFIPFHSHPNKLTKQLKKYITPKIKVYFSDNHFNLLPYPTRSWLTSR